MITVLGWIMYPSSHVSGHTFIKNMFVIIVQNLKINATCIFDSKAHSVIWFVLSA